jgi:hypothetical protein
MTPMNWKWREREPSLDELLDDEMMVRVMRSTGIDSVELKRRLADLAHRLGGPSRAGEDCCQSA